MRLFHIAFAIAATMLTSAAILTERIADRIFAAVLSILPPTPRLAQGDEPALALDLGGRALDRSLQQQLRHEAGVPRYSAPRRI